MKYITLFALILMANISTAQDNWEPFTSEEGRFTVLSPGEMDLRVNALEVAIGELKYFTYFHQPADTLHNLLYQVSYCDYPKGTIHSDSVDFIPEFLEDNIKSSAESVSGELVYSDDISYYEYPGKLFKIFFSDGEGSIKSKIFIVGNRLYTVSAISMRNKSLNPMVDTFLESFRINGLNS